MMGEEPEGKSDKNTPEKKVEKEEEKKPAQDGPPQLPLIEKDTTTVEKHETQDEWTFWYVYTLSHNEKKKQGKKGRHHEYILHEVYSFKTVEDFWAMYNNIYSVEEIMPNTDYMMFKKGIRPEWEDVNNRKGGKWCVTLPI